MVTSHCHRSPIALPATNSSTGATASCSSRKVEYSAQILAGSWNTAGLSNAMTTHVGGPHRLPCNEMDGGRAGGRAGHIGTSIGACNVAVQRGATPCDGHMNAQSIWSPLQPGSHRSPGLYSCYAIPPTHSYCMYDLIKVTGPCPGGGASGSQSNLNMDSIPIADSCISSCRMEPARSRGLRRAAGRRHYAANIQKSAGRCMDEQTCCN